MHRLRPKLSYSNVISTLCLFLLLGGGTAYAASELGRESVGTRELAKGAVTPSKLSRKSKAALTGPTGPRGATGAKGDQGERGPIGDTGAAGSALAYARVEPNGTLVAAESKNMGGAVVTRGSEGHYCFSNLPFTPHNVVASPQAALTSINVATVVFPTCPAGTQVSVEIWDINTVGEVDSAFMIIFN
jgi:hypothetical protein